MGAFRYGLEGYNQTGHEHLSSSSEFMNMERDLNEIFSSADADAILDLYAKDLEHLQVYINMLRWRSEDRLKIVQSQIDCAQFSISGNILRATGRKRILTYTLTLANGWKRSYRYLFADLATLKQYLSTLQLMYSGGDWSKFSSVVK